MLRGITDEDHRPLRALQIPPLQLLVHHGEANRCSAALGDVVEMIDLNHRIEGIEVIQAPLARRPIDLSQRRIVFIVFVVAVDELVKLNNLLLGCLVLFVRFSANHIGLANPPCPSKDIALYLC